MKYKVRFHLQRGQHYMHWQIKAWVGTVKYLDPQKYQLKMRGCTLINKKKAAEKVYAAGKKNVCGWVECKNSRVRILKYFGYPGKVIRREFLALNNCQNTAKVDLKYMTCVRYTLEEIL